MKESPSSGRPGTSSAVSVLWVRLRASLDAWLDRQGENVPIQPAYIDYPVPPRHMSTVAMQVGMALLIWLILGSWVATEIVAHAAHYASALGEAAGGIYTPDEFWHWLSWKDHLTRADVESLAAAGARPSEFFGSFDVGLVAIFGSLIPGVAMACIVAARPAKIPRNLASLKGTQEWATLKQVRGADLVWDGVSDAVILGAFERPRLFGIFKRKPVILAYKGPRHVKTEAASRSGKDVGTNTFTLAKSWRPSVIDNDPKGEGHLQTSGVRYALFGNDIVRFAPLAAALGEQFVDEDDETGAIIRVEEFGSTRWQPLGEVDLGTEDEFSQLLQICTLVVDPTGKQIDGDNSHWIKTSRTVIKALSTKVAYDPLEVSRTLSRVAALFGGGPDAFLASPEAAEIAGTTTDGAVPGTIQEMLEQYLGFTASGFGARPSWLTRSIEDLRLRSEHELLTERAKIGTSMSEAEFIRFEAERRRLLDRRIQRLESEMRHPDLERDLRNSLRIQGDEASSVYSTVNSNLTTWLDPRVIRNTAMNDFKILDIANRPNPVTCYVVSSVSRADMAFPIIKLFMTLAYRKLVPEMAMDRVTKRTKSPWKHPVLWLMNERGSLKTIEVEQEVVPVAASYNMLYHYLFQTPRQLKEIGGENDVIGPNCGVKVYHTPQEYEDAEVLAKMLGNRTVYVEQQSFDHTGRRSRSWQTEAMPMMTPEQAMLMPTEPKFEWTTDAAGNKVPLRTLAHAYQIIDAPNCPPIYSLKIQWFADPQMRDLMAATTAVVPYPLRVDRARKIRYAAEEQARAAYRVETPSRSAARAAEAVRLERFTLPEPEPPKPPAPPPVVAAAELVESVSVEPAAVPGASLTRKRRVVAMDERVVAAVRRDGERQHGLEGFGSILGARDGKE